jgi:hypothetical protein
MSFNYDEQTLWLDDLTGRIAPGAQYALCETHAERLTPPVGWTLVDRRRPVRPLFVSLEVA